MIMTNTWRALELRMRIQLVSAGQLSRNLSWILLKAVRQPMSWALPLDLDSNKKKFYVSHTKRNG